MAKLHSKPKPKVQWSEETIRRRSVRAVVAALRLSKEFKQLSRERACHLEEARILKRYLNQIRSLNTTLRELLKQRNGQNGSRMEMANAWRHHGNSHSEKRNSRQRN
jgi:hypothetical protein